MSPRPPTGRSRLRGRSGCEGQDRWSARRGTAPAGGGPAPPPGRAGGASHPSTCAPAISGVGQVELLSRPRARPRMTWSDRCASSPTRRRFSRPVRFSSTAANWPARPMDCARPGDRPRRRHRARQPARRCRSTVVMIRTAVVLPALLAQQPEDPVRRHGEVDTLEHNTLANRFAAPRPGSHHQPFRQRPTVRMRVHAPRPGRSRRA